MTAEIADRWRERRWPSIGYFVHGQAYQDIHTLLDRVAFLENGIADIRHATTTGAVCDDVAWFSDIETLWDHCGWLLDPSYYDEEPTPKVDAARESSP